MTSTRHHIGANMAFVLSIIAAILILVGGIVWFVDSSFYTQYTALGGFNPNIANYILGGVTILFAIIILIGASYVYMTGGYEMVGGIIVVIFSMISIVTGGGFIVGTMLGIVGGIWGIFRTQESVKEAVIEPTKDNEEREKF